MTGWIWTVVVDEHGRVLEWECLAERASKVRWDQVDKTASLALIQHNVQLDTHAGSVYKMDSCNYYSSIMLS